MAENQKRNSTDKARVEDQKSVQSAYLTSGGDAPGMNAAIRAVVRTALGKRTESTWYQKRIFTDF